MRENLSMETAEQLFTNAQKINFLLESAILYYFDSASLETELIINLIQDTNAINLKKLESIVYND